MLMKAININLKMIKNEIELSLGFFLPAVLFGPSAFGLQVFLVALIAAFIAQIKGYSKIYGTSIYGDEAGLYMTLPLSPNSFILSKVLIGVIWNMLMSLVIIVYLFIVVFLGEGSDGVTGIFDILSQKLLQYGMNPLQVGVFMGSLPLELVLSGFLWGLTILTLQNLGMRSTLGRLQKLRPSTLTGLSMVTVIVISLGLNQLSNIFLSAGQNIFYYDIAALILKASIALFLYRYCRISFERRYDLKC